MVAVTITNQNLDLKRMVRSELAEEMNCLEGDHDIGFLKIVKGIFSEGGELKPAKCCKIFTKDSTKKLHRFGRNHYNLDSIRLKSCGTRPSKCLG